LEEIGMYRYVSIWVLHVQYTSDTYRPLSGLDFDTSRYETILSRYVSNSSSWKSWIYNIHIGNIIIYCLYHFMIRILWNTVWNCNTYTTKEQQILNYLVTNNIYFIILLSYILVLLFSIINYYNLSGDQHKVIKL